MSERHWQRPALASTALAQRRASTAAQLKGALLTKVGTAPGRTRRSR